jgi:hypothetical protein
VVGIGCRPRRHRRALPRHRSPRPRAPATPALVQAAQAGPFAVSSSWQSATGRLHRLHHRPRKVVTAGHCLTRDAAGGLPLPARLPGGLQLTAATARLQAVPTPPARRQAWAHRSHPAPPPTCLRPRARLAVLTTAQSALSECHHAPLAHVRDGRPTASRHAIKLGGYLADSRFADMTGPTMRSQGG